MKIENDISLISRGKINKRTQLVVQLVANIIDVPLARILNGHNWSPTKCKSGDNTGLVNNKIACAILEKCISLLPRLKQVRRDKQVHFPLVAAAQQ
jgi:hypothetical protein